MMGMKNHCRFNKEEMVIHPIHGVSIIKDIIEKKVFGRKEKYYVIQPKMDKLQEILIPIRNSSEIGLRKLSQNTEFKKIMQILSQTHDLEVEGGYWNRQYAKRLEMVQSGNIYQVSQVLKMLYDRRCEKMLSYTDEELYTKAYKLILSELSHSTTIDEEEIEIMINFTLGA
ncbi:MAG: CarD family transcriptional regulator [Candidatus Muiribacteriota bacterium]